MEYWYDFRPVASLLITGGGVFVRFWTFLGFENWSSQCMSRGNLHFKIIMIDDITLWSKLEST